MENLLQCYRDLDTPSVPEKFIKNIEQVCEKSINIKSKYKSLTLYNRKGFDNRYSALNINGVIIEPRNLSDLTQGYRFAALQPKSVTRIDIKRVKNIALADYDIFAGYDGSTITLYHNSETDSWELMNSTHIFAANCTYFDPNTNLNAAFQLALQQAGYTLNYEDLNQKYCYSFLLSHPGWHPLMLSEPADSCTKIALIQALNLDTLNVSYAATPEQNVELYNLPAEFKWLYKYTKNDMKGVNIYNLINERNKRDIVIMRHKSGYDCSADNVDYYIEPVYFKNIRDIFYSSKSTDIDVCIIHSIISRDKSKHATLQSYMSAYYGPIFRRFNKLSECIYRSMSYINTTTIFDNEDAYINLIRQYKLLVEEVPKLSTYNKSAEVCAVEYSRFLSVFHATMHRSELLELCRELIITKPNLDTDWRAILDFDSPHTESPASANNE